LEVRYMLSASFAFHDLEYVDRGDRTRRARMRAKGTRVRRKEPRGADA
jgi:hypothetical protein